MNTLLLLKNNIILLSLKRALDDIGTKYGSFEVNKAEEGDMTMNVVSAVTGNRMVSKCIWTQLSTS